MGLCIGCLHSICIHKTYMFTHRLVVALEGCALWFWYEWLYVCNVCGFHVLCACAQSALKFWEDITPLAPYCNHAWLPAQSCCWPGPRSRWASAPPGSSAGPRNPQKAECLYTVSPAPQMLVPHLHQTRAEWPEQYPAESRVLVRAGIARRPHDLAQPRIYKGRWSELNALSPGPQEELWTNAQGHLGHPKVV